MKTWKTKKAGDLSLLFLLFWLFGEFLNFIYIIIDDMLIKITNFPLYVNYFFNIILVVYLVYVKKYYR
ncbi:hypothetical protein J4411_01370 [Candidatus Pacearchaeota archaeon]|nr:hypothetical protein [Candidatus Pacearchaeota archaeon]